jgi:predicted dehydrogenase
MLEWSNGALGTLLVSTAQSGEPERLEIVGTRGALLLHNGTLTFSEADADLFEFMRDDPNPFARLPYAPRPVDLEPGEGDGTHLAIYRNFVSAIQDGTPLVADGVEGRMSLEVANALILSSHTGRAVELPLDRAAYTQLLEEKRSEFTATV